MLENTNGYAREGNLTLVWIVLGLGAAYLIYGIITPNPHRRVFADGLPEDQVENGYLMPREVIDPDENVIAKRISDAFVAQTKRLPPHIGQNDPTFHEPHWGHTNGILRGCLLIDRVENLPEKFRAGSSKRTSAISQLPAAAWPKTPILVLR